MFPKGKMGPTKYRSPCRRAAAFVDSGTDVPVLDAEEKSGAERPATQYASADKAEGPKVELERNIDPACYKCGKLVTLRHDPSGKCRNAPFSIK